MAAASTGRGGVSTGICAGLNVGLGALDCISLMSTEYPLARLVQLAPEPRGFDGQLLHAGEEHVVDPPLPLERQRHHLWQRHVGGKAQHVGGGILAAELAVEAACLGLVAWAPGTFSSSVGPLTQ